MDLGELIEANDPDGLLRHIDGVTAARDWPGLVDVRDRCNAAVARGKELWGVAAYAEYRLALEAPGDWAAAVLREGAGRYGLGPLWEVAASSHGFSDLASGVPDLRTRTLVAMERVLRGEDLTDRDDIDVDLLAIPPRLCDFEAGYAVATYRRDRVEAPEPETTAPWDPIDCSPGMAGDPDEVTEALYGLVAPWVEQSTGTCLLAATAGGVTDAFGILYPGQVRGAPLDTGEALALMAWAAASGGTFGRRRGGAVGRSLAWWAAATAADVNEEWPLDPARLGVALEHLQWVRFDPGPIGGWQLHLAVAHEAAGRAWAVSAVDRAEDETPL